MTRPLNLVPRCDRCGRFIATEYLHDDGLGYVCPGCLVGGQEVLGA